MYLSLLSASSETAQKHVVFKKCFKNRAAIECQKWKIKKKKNVNPGTYRSHSALQASYLSFSCNSSWARLCREFIFHQKSAQANSHSMWLRSWSGIRKSLRYSRDHLAAARVAKDNLAYWQCSSVCDSKNLRLPRFSIVCGRNQFESRESMEGEDWLASNFTSILRIGSNRRSRWSSSGQFS